MNVQQVPGVARVKRWDRGDAAGRLIKEWDSPASHRPLRGATLIMELIKGRDLRDPEEVDSGQNPLISDPDKERSEEPGPEPLVWGWD